eukprot:SAG11_NODE_102_length_16709_cov_31.066093_24_plen_61_part_00
MQEHLKLSSAELDSFLDSCSQEDLDQKNKRRKNETDTQEPRISNGGGINAIQGKIERIDC